MGLALLSWLFDAGLITVWFWYEDVIWWQPNDSSINNDLMMDRWRSDDALMTLCWHSDDTDDTLMTLMMLWLCSDDDLMTLRCRIDDSLMTLWWCSDDALMTLCRHINDSLMMLWWPSVVTLMTVWWPLWHV